MDFLIQFTAVCSAGNTSSCRPCHGPLSHAMGQHYLVTPPGNLHVPAKEKSKLKNQYSRINIFIKLFTFLLTSVLLVANVSKIANSNCLLMLCYRCDCSVRTGFTLFGHCSWQANLIFWMAALAAVGREAEGVRIRYTLGHFFSNWRIWWEIGATFVPKCANLIQNSLKLWVFLVGLMDWSFHFEVIKLKKQPFCFA